MRLVAMGRSFIFSLGIEIAIAVFYSTFCIMQDSSKKKLGNSKNENFSQNRRFRSGADLI